MTIQIATVEEAASYLERLVSGENLEDFSLTGEMDALHIMIDGDKYHSSVPGELARGLWQYQEQIYAAAALAIHGSRDIRKLTLEERESLELVFEVNAGCSDLKAHLGKLVEKIGDSIVTMDNATKKKIILCIVGMLVAGYVGEKVIAATVDAYKDNNKKDQVVQMEAERTRQFDIFAKAMAGNKVVDGFKDASIEGSKAIVRAAGDAKEIEIGRISLDQDDIQAINSRSPKARSEPDVLDMDFRIFKVDVRNEGSMKYVLAGPGTGEFVAIMDESQFSAEELANVLSAAQERKRVRLEVVITRANGVIRSAQITQVF